MPWLEIVVVTWMTGWAWSVGRGMLRALDRGWGGESESWAVAILLGFGVLALGVLGLGMVGWLNGGAIGGLMVAASLSSCCGMVVGRHCAGHEGLAPATRGFSLDRIDGALRGVLAVGVGGTLLTALAPVTDGDALCYHLQVPKVFLERGRVVFEPDLHETVYPLVVEMLYVPALAWGGPVACRLISWVLGVCFAGVTTGMARPVLGRRAGWAGAIALLAPAISNGMSAPLNDVALAAYCGAALWALGRWVERPSIGRAALVGILSGLAIGVKYPGLVWVGLIGVAMWVLAVRKRRAGDWAIAAALLVAVGGAWYARAAWHTGNPVHPFFRHMFGGSGLDEVLEPAKRPMAVTPGNLLTALGPMTLNPDRFDSVSHQFGPLFLALLPGLLVVRPPRRVVVLALFGMAFYIACLTQRQSMRFVLPALGPWAVGAAWMVGEARRRSPRAGMVVGCLVLGFLVGEAGLALGRARHGLPVLLGRESRDAYLARREPTYTVGRWIDANLPKSSRIVGQDHRGFYLPRPYTMELAHRRRTGLAADGASAREVIESLRERGFTHVLLCPPVPEDAVEFDATLGRVLESWLEDREPLYRADLADADGVVRRYAIHALEDVAPVRLAGGHAR